MKKLIILHEYKAYEHFNALFYLIEVKYKNVKIEFFEYSIIKNLYMAIQKRTLGTIISTIKTVIELFKLYFTKNEFVILAIAPYDFKLIFMKRLLKKHNVFYYTSWPYWNYEYYPKHFFAETALVKRAWRDFLETQVKGFFVVTKSVKNSLSLHYKINGNLSVVYHSYDENIFYPEEMLKIKPKTSYKKIVCLFVGRLRYEKGIDRILRIINRVSEVYFDFHIVGSGPFSKQVVEISKKLNVFYHSYVADRERLSDIYRNSNVLLLPSRRIKRWEELFGLVIIEAMACGNIVIATDHVGPKELIRNGFNGFVLKEDKYVNDTVELLQRLSEDRDTLSLMRKNSLDFAKKFTYEMIAQKWDVILNSYFVNSKLNF